MEQWTDMYGRVQLGSTRHIIQLSRPTRFDLGECVLEEHSLLRPTPINQAVGSNSIED